MIYKIFNYLWYISCILLFFLILITPGGLALMLKIIMAAFLVFIILVVTVKLKEKKTNIREFSKIREEYLKNPENLNKFIELGYAALNNDDFDQANNVFYKIMSQYPDRPAGYCGLGLLEFKKKNFQKAKCYFDKTIELDSKYEVAKEKILYMQKNNLF